MLNKSGIYIIIHLYNFKMSLYYKGPKPRNGQREIITLVCTMQALDV